MNTIILNQSQKEKTQACPIIIGNNLVGKINTLFDLSVFSRIVVVTDTNTERLFLKTLLCALPKSAARVVLPTGEKEKNFKNVQKILIAMHKAYCDRDTLVINLGGGVVSDIGGFAASIFMRGVSILNIPTTLLAQADASIGGKTGINFLGIKNLVGTFAQPIGVVIDVTTLRSLPGRELISGFAEIIKHGLVANRTLFHLATCKTPRDFTNNKLIAIITKSCRVKADIVSCDHTEQHERKLLNFGHTIGHAVEALSQTSVNPILHGEAVVIGMMVEAKISELSGLLSQTSCSVIEEALTSLPLPKLPEVIPIQNIMDVIRSDKKSKNGIIQWTLLTEIGKGIINQVVCDNTVIAALKQTKGIIV
ncbi:MAG TPA: 3-dehydroquinate synthase [Patescibacteria group bacterium]|nr:3-dehydroquinate synthase [Patescibacteria group bacterium]